MLRALLFLTLLPSSAFSQTILRGVVQDAATGKPIPYATVGLVKENTGTTSGEDGRFELRSEKPKAEDSLLFQGLGYASFKMAVSAFSAGSGTVSLSGKIRELQEVGIRPKPLLQKAVLNKHSRRSHHSYGSVGYISQMAQHFTAPALPALLEETSIRTMNSKGRFRLRIYRMDTLTKGPGEDLCGQSIELDARGGETTIDLRPYSIYLHEKDFFIAVEWLKIPANEDWYNMKIDGKKVRRFGSYMPSVDFSRTQTTEVRMWHQTYTGEWKRMDKFATLPDHPATNFAIEAGVRY